MSLLGGLILCLPLIALAVLFEFLTGAALQRTYTLFLINLIAVIGLGIFSGNSGILSFGHVAFIGLGAYVSGILTLPLATKASALPHLPAMLAGIEWGLPAALLATVICVGIFGALIGAPIVRMGGAAAVIATLGLLLIVHGIIIGASDFTRGSNAFLGVAKKTDLWVALALAVPIILLARWYRNSRRGAQLRASREDELAARAIGIDVVKMRHRRLDRERHDLRRGGRAAGAFSRRLLALQVLFRRHPDPAHHADRRRHDDGLRRLVRRGAGDADGRDPAPGRGRGRSVRLADAGDVRADAGRPLPHDPHRHVSPAGGPVRARDRRSAGCAPRAAAPRADSDLSVAAAGELTIEAATKDFSGLRALENVSVTVRPGEIVGLIGPNGSGKTTLLNLVSGVLSPSAGRILIDGADATRWPAHKVAQAGIGRTFQNIRLFGHLSVLENVEIAATTRADGSAESARALARQLLAEFGLEGSADRLAGELDYGAQRRLEIARALALRPRYLLLDEPAAGMNPTESNQLLAELAELRRRTGIALLVIDHDMSLIMRLCDRIVVLNRGQVIAHGKPAEIQRDPAVIEAYIGRKRAARVPTATSLQMQGATP